MHRALIVSSKYDPATGYPDRQAWRVSSKRLGLRLQQHGYAVEWLDPGPGLVSQLREALATEDPLSAVVLVFSGYVLLTETGEPAILLSDEQVIALRLEQLCSKAGRTFGRVLLVVDGVRGSSTRVVQEANPQARDAPAESLLAQMSVRAVSADNTGMLVRVAPWGAPDVTPDSGLCERLSMILENLDDAHALATPELELDLLDTNENDASALLCRHSKPAFVFLPARRFASEPPKAEARASGPVGAPESEAEHSIPVASPLPSEVDSELPNPSAEASDAGTSGEAEEAWEDSDEPPAHATGETEGPSGAALARTGPGRAAEPAQVSDDEPEASDQEQDRQAWTPPPDEGGSGSSVARSSAAASVEPLHVGRAGLSFPPPLPPLPPFSPPPLIQPQPAAPTPPAPTPPAPSPAQPLSAARPSLPPLGTPPPLPSERAAARPSHGAPSSSESPAARPSERLSAPGVRLGTPPPLPSERVSAAASQSAGEFAPPGPGDGAQAATAQPASAQPASAQPASVEPDGKQAAVPPPLPVLVPPPPPLTPHLAATAEAHNESDTRDASPVATEASLSAPPPLPLERGDLLRVEPPAPDVGDVQRSDANASPTGDVSVPAHYPSTDTPSSAAPDAVGSSAASEQGYVSPNNAASAPPPSPPPRKSRDSLGAPSLPPPVFSADSWRPASAVESTPRDEAALLETAQSALARNDEGEALSHAKRCLEFFPESARALQIAATVLVSHKDFEALAALYDELIARLSPSPSAAQLCAAASRLWSAELHDAERARTLMAQGLDLDPKNSSLHRELADLLEASGESEQALRHSLDALRFSPMSPTAARAAYQRLQGSQAEDTKFTVAGLLSFLGHTTNHVVDFLASKRSASLPRPARSLNETDYAFGLDVTETDPELTRVLTVLEPSVRKLHLLKPKQQRQLFETLRAEDVERSTTMLARTFAWTCRLLTLGTPALYLSDAEALPGLLPAENTSYVVGKSLGRGLSLVELAFLWGRALGWARPQTRILYTLPAPLQLVSWLRALRVASGLEEPTSSEIKALAKSLRKELPSSALDALAPSLRTLDSDLELRVAVWRDAADRIATRFGLISCGDAELAARTLDRFPTADGGNRRQQLSELWAYALSEDYASLRQRLGLHGS